LKCTLLGGIRDPFVRCSAQPIGSTDVGYRAGAGRSITGQVKRSGVHGVARRLLGTLAFVVCLGIVAVPPASAQDRDCGDFADQAAAQAYFIALGGPASDPDRLDGDADGIACESLPCPCGSSPTAEPTPTPTPVPTPTATPPPTRRSARIVRVVDGDTLRVRLSSGRQTTVRLIGIDTPETKRPGAPIECGGTSASAYMRRIAFHRGRGRPVTLVGDPSQAATDQYGRTLAYVDASGKGDLGRLMLRAGWASVYETAFGRLAGYRSAAGRAQAQHAGVWGRCDGEFHRPA
jgi:endonuclease YncB( thermonuclease family)